MFLGCRERVHCEHELKQQPANNFSLVRSHVDQVPKVTGCQAKFLVVITFIEMPKRPCRPPFLDGKHNSGPLKRLVKQFPKTCLAEKIELDFSYYILYFHVNKHRQTVCTAKMLKNH